MDKDVVCKYIHIHRHAHNGILHAYMCAQWCPTLCGPTDYSPPGSSVHGIILAGILKWIAISYSRGSSQPREGTRASPAAPALAGGFFTTGKAMEYSSAIKKNETMPYAATWMKPRYHYIILCKVSQTQKNKYYIIQMWNQKNKSKWTYLQNRNSFTDIENKFMVTKGESGKGGGEDKLGVWDYQKHTTMCKRDKQHGLTV